MTEKIFSLDSFARRAMAEHAASRRPYFVGITGFDGSGKTVMTQQLESLLRAANAVVQVVHVDDFHFPRDYRYAGSAGEPTKYLHQSFDFDRLVSEVLRPARQRGEFSAALTCLNVATDQRDVVRHYEISARTLVLVEGVFLLRPDLRPFLDCTLFLEAQDQTLVSRGGERDLRLLGLSTDDKFRNKYLPAQHQFHGMFPPNEFADIVVDNENPRAPLIKMARPAWMQ